jgi:acetyltransferase-like isoleucine patch superfamily enzyme
MSNPFVSLGSLLRGQWARLVVAAGGQEAKIRLLRKTGVRIGDRCRIYTGYFGTEPYLVRIGNHCTITSGVRFITHDGSCWVLRDELANLQDFGPIVVEDNCFIGVNAIILPGVRIGPNSIVGAGSIVTKDVPPEVVVGGIPARVLMPIAKYRERKMQIDANRDVPTDPAAKRTYLEKRFAAFLNRSRDD